MTDADFSYCPAAPSTPEAIIRVESSVQFDDLEEAFRACRGAELLQLEWVLTATEPGEWVVTVAIERLESSVTRVLEAEVPRVPSFEEQISSAFSTLSRFASNMEKNAKKNKGGDDV